MTTASGFVPALVGVLEGLAAALQHQHRSRAAFPSHASASLLEVSAMLRHLHAFLLTNMFTPELIADPVHNRSASYLRSLIHRVQLDLYALFVSSAEFADLPTRLLAAMLLKSLASISPSSPPSPFAGALTDATPGARGAPASLVLSSLGPSPVAAAPRKASDVSPPALRFVSFDVSLGGEREPPHTLDARLCSLRAAAADGSAGALGATEAVPAPRPGGAGGAAAAFGHLPGFFFSNFGGNMALYSPHHLGVFLGLLAELTPPDLLAANVENFVAWITWPPPHTHATGNHVGVAGRQGVASGGRPGGPEEAGDANAFASARAPPRGTLSRRGERLAEGRREKGDENEPAELSGRGSGGVEAASHREGVCGVSQSPQTSSFASQAALQSKASRPSILTSLFPSSASSVSSSSARHPSHRVGPEGDGMQATPPAAEKPQRSASRLLHSPAVARLFAHAETPREASREESGDAPPAPLSTGFVFAPPVGHGARGGVSELSQLPLALRQAALGCLLSLLQRCFCESGDAFSVVGRRSLFARSACFAASRASSLGWASAEGGGEAWRVEAASCVGGDRVPVEDFWVQTLCRAVRRVEAWSVELLVSPQSEGPAEESQGKWALLRNFWRGEKRGTAILEADGKPCREMFTCLCVAEDFTDEHRLSIQFFSAIYAWMVTVYHRQIAFERQKQIGEEAVFKLIHFGFLPRSSLQPSGTPFSSSSLAHESRSASALLKRRVWQSAPNEGEEEGEEEEDGGEGGEEDEAEGAAEKEEEEEKRTDAQAEERGGLDAEEKVEGTAEQNDEEFRQEANGKREEAGVHDLVQRLVQMTRRFDVERSMLASVTTRGVEGEEEREAGDSSEASVGSSCGGRGSASLPGREASNAESDFASSDPPGLHSDLSSRRPCSRASSSSSRHSICPPHSASPASSPDPPAPQTSPRVAASPSARLSASSAVCVGAAAPGGVSLLRRLLPLDRRFLAAVAAHCIRLLSQLELQQSLRRLQVLRMREKSEKPSFAASLPPWALLWKRTDSRKDILARFASSLAANSAPSSSANFAAFAASSSLSSSVSPSLPSSPLPSASAPSALSRSDDERAETPSASLFAKTAAAAFATSRYSHRQQGAALSREGDGEKKHKNPFADGGVQIGGAEVWRLGQRAGISEAVWELQMADAVGTEAMRILDLVCQSDSQYVATVFPTIKRVCERTLAGVGGLHLFTCVFHFYLHHQPNQLLSLDTFVQQYVTHLGLHYRSVLLSMNALTFLNNNMQALVVKTSIFTRYFPVIFKLVAYHPRVSGSLLLPLLPAIVGPGTLMEVLHSLLDLPLTASFLERFDADGASAAAFFAPSFFSSSGEVCAGAAALSVSTADGACPLLRALKAYLLRNEAGGHSVIWEAEDNAAVLASIDSLWRRLPITSRLSAVCKVVPAVLQVYFRVVLEDAPPFYIGKFDFLESANSLSWPAYRLSSPTHSLRAAFFLSIFRASHMHTYAK
ncbi:hypothetical protein TGRUB_248150A, partial [Toxoplasma gondii RUB]